MTGEIVALISLGFSILLASITVAFGLGRHAERIRTLEMRTAALEALQRVPAIEATVEQIIDGQSRMRSYIEELRAKVERLIGENHGYQRASRPDIEEDT